MKRRVFLATYAVALVAISCNNQITEFECDTALDAEVERIVDGARHFNPHSVDAMREACRILYPTSRNGVDLADEIIVATHKYVRFLPANKAQMDALLDTEWELFNYPMDYEFPDSVNLSTYHDPDIPEDQITWQYTVIPINEPITDTITYQLLEECYIPDDEEEVQTSVGVVNIAQIENLSYEIASGNSESASTMALINPVQTYTGDILVDSIPVKGVKVRMKRGLVVKTAYTSELGKYSIRGRLGSSPTTEVLFDNMKGFKLGYEYQLILPSTISLGVFRNINMETNVTYKGWVLGHMNNAAYDYYNWCTSKGITTPPSNMRLWAITGGMGGAACPMLHHYVPLYWHVGIPELIDYFLFPRTRHINLIPWVRILLAIFGPDVVLTKVNVETAENIHNYVYHELTHSAHFKAVRNNYAASALWWSDVIDYEVLQAIMSEDNDPYGNGTASNCGPAGVAEMWAHAVDQITQYEIYGGAGCIVGLQMEYEGEEYWFKPSSIWDLYVGGVPIQTLFQCLSDPNVRSVELYKSKLLQIASPEYHALINSKF